MGLVATSRTRVEQHTAPSVNERIVAETGGNAAYYAEHPERISARLAELDREWDIERWLQLNSSVLTLAGLALAGFRGRRWLIAPSAIQAMFLLHAVHGWCPPLPVLRRMGVRTMREIEAERNALLAVRDGPRAAGGVPHVQPPSPSAAERPDDGRAVVPTRHRVRDHTPEPVNRRLDEATERRVRFYAQRPEHARRRLRELDEEWDVERVIEVEAPVLSLIGIAAAASGRRAWLGLPVVVQGMMVLHAFKGAFPTLGVMRLLGLRTQDEIDRGRTAIRALEPTETPKGPAHAARAAFEDTLAAP